MTPKRDDFGMGVAAFVQDAGGWVLFIRENYGLRRYGFPGGAVEPGETLHDALVREFREEVCAELTVNHLVALDHSATETGGSWLYVLFDCSMSGLPRVPDTGEIAVMWVDPSNPPLLLTNAAQKFLGVAASGAKGLVGWLSNGEG